MLGIVEVVLQDFVYKIKDFADRSNKNCTYWSIEKIYYVPKDWHVVTKDDDWHVEIVQRIVGIVGIYWRIVSKRLEDEIGKDKVAVEKANVLVRIDIFVIENETVY